MPLNVSEGFYPTTPLPELRAASRRAVLQELVLPDDARLLITSGRVLPIKGFNFLVDALPAILARTRRPISSSTAPTVAARPTRCGRKWPRWA